MDILVHIFMNVFEHFLPFSALLIFPMIMLPILFVAFYLGDKDKDKDRGIVTSNEETISFLTYKISEIYGNFFSNNTIYSYEREFSKYKRILMELSEELLYIDSRNTERINEIANDISFIEVAVKTNNM